MRWWAAFSTVAICTACGGGDGDVVINASMLNAVPRNERVVLSVSKGAPFYVFSESHGPLDAARIDLRFEGSISTLTDLAASRDMRLTSWDGVRVGCRTQGVLEVDAPAIASSASALKQHVDNPGQTPMKYAPSSAKRP